MDLEQNGYVILSNKLTIDEQQLALSSIGDKVDYTIVKQFIDESFLNVIQRNLPFFDKPVYLKCRLSNNNNSVDASVLHSDAYNYTNEPIIPIYTALCYFDKAEL